MTPEQFSDLVQVLVVAIGSPVCFFLGLIAGQQR